VAGAGEGAARMERTGPRRDFVTVVSGVPRSGTSLLMQMLAAGGLDPLQDGVRPADADNPRGYFEYAPVKRLPESGGWVSAARGRAVKVVHALVPLLPEATPYRVVLVRRAWDEVLASQAVMLARTGRTSDDLPPDRLVAVFEAQLEALLAWARRVGAPVLEVSFAEVLMDPGGAAAALDVFLGGGLDRDEMSGAVDPVLYRQRVCSP
jgi:hypothetical protein